MANTFREIRVFISSCCDGEFSSLRNELQKAINDTHVFEAYLFEEQGASTITARESYISELKDCDVCVFIVKESVGLSGGVLEEIKTAFQYKKKKLFYFVGYQGGVPSEISDLVHGAEASVYCSNLDTLDQVKDKVIEDLQNDVLRVYRYHCSNAFSFSENSDDLSALQQAPSDISVLPKQSLNNLSATMSILAVFYFAQQEEDNPTNEIDRLIADLMQRLVKAGSVNEFPFELLLNEVKSCTNSYYDIELISERWKALQSYYASNFELAVEHEKHALELAEERNAPSWIKKDILIDLRNMSFPFSSIGFEYQKMLEDDETVLVYPLIDRLDSELYSELKNDHDKEIIRSINSVVYGNNLRKLFGEVSQILLVASAYGSITHISLLKKRLEAIALFLCEKYGTRQFGIPWLFLLLTDGDAKKLERSVQSMIGLDNVSNSEEAKKLYEAVLRCAKPGKNLVVQFMAFRYLGPYMSEKDFNTYSIDYKAAVQNTIRSDKRDLQTVETMFEAMRVNASRLEEDWIFEQCIAALKGKTVDLSEGALKTISLGCVDFNDRSNDQIRELLCLVQSSIKQNENLLERYAALCLVHIALTRDDMTGLCRNLATSTLSDSSIRLFDIEVGAHDKTDGPLIEAFKFYVDAIERGNLEQGKNGEWFFSALAEYENVGNMLEAVVSPPSEMIMRASRAAAQTIKASNHSTGTKTKACYLLLRLLALNRDVVKDVIREELDFSNIDRYSISSGFFPEENDTQLSYFTCLSLLLVALEEKEIEELISNLTKSFEAGNYVQARVLEGLTYFIKAVKNENLSAVLTSYIFSYASRFLVSNYFQIRSKALELFFELLNVPEVASLTARLLMNQYENVSPNEKCRIIRAYHSIEKADKKAWDEMRELILDDPCEIPRYLLGRLTDF